VRSPPRAVPEAGRVIAGTARGIRLRAPGPGTRPLGDRVKQSLFASLEPRLRGATVLDLFAGSGAAGIEALSRGARRCDFVERDREACVVIAGNLAATGLAARGTVHRRDVLAFLGAAGADAPTGPGTYDLAIVDPPYGDPVMLATLERLGSGERLSGSALVVTKHFWRDDPPERIGVLVRALQRRYGETALTVYRRHPAEPRASVDPAAAGGS
jgi:16S rRNA (guanine966-N2)-methyltransferase